MSRWTGRQRIGHWLLASIVVVVSMTAVPAPAWAAVLPTDAGVVAGSFSQIHNGSPDTWSDQGVMQFYIHNYGPNTMQSSTWWIEYVAPGGTQFHAAQQFFDCIEVVALTDYRCSGGQLFVDDPANYEGTCCNRVDIKLTIVGPVTSPARVTVDYPDDPNSSNDSATLSINPHAVTPTVGASPAAPTAAPGSPAPARSSRSSAAARPSGFSAAPTSAALGDSPGASATTDAPAGGVPATLPSATPRLASGSHSGGAAVVFWIVVAVVFVGAAAAGSLFLIRRRRTT